MLPHFPHFSDLFPPSHLRPILQKAQKSENMRHRKVKQYHLNRYKKHFHRNLIINRPDNAIKTSNIIGLGRCHLHIKIVTYIRIALQNNKPPNLRV